MSGHGHARRARRAAGSFGLLDFPRDPNDEYETPVEAVERLLRLETFVGGCWNSSCGRGNILKALCACLPAHEAIVGSDLHEAAMASALRETCSVAFGQDFLAATVMRDGCRNIVINPPFKAAMRNPPRPQASARRRQAGGAAAVKLDCSPKASRSAKPPSEHNNRGPAKDAAPWHSRPGP